MYSHNHPTLNGDTAVCCDTCGCCLNLQSARTRMWGTLATPEGVRKPQCSVACAETLYTKEYVASNWQAATE